MCIELCNEIISPHVPKDEQTRLLTFPKQTKVEADTKQHKNAVLPRSLFAHKPKFAETTKCQQMLIPARLCHKPPTSYLVFYQNR